MAGAVNSIAGGGTLITFPALIELGMDGKVANVTSTMGLFPGSFGSAWGYRREIRRIGKALILFLIPSIFGGLVGAELLLATKGETFDVLVPWLILGATILFMLQAPLLRWLRSRRAEALSSAPSQPRWLVVIPFQFLVAVYGGYFGAGIGILMLATLGSLGIDDIHQSNGIKNLAAACINCTAAIRFGLSGTVVWPVALIMAVAAILGGYASAGLARRIAPTTVRWVIVVIGLLATVRTAYDLYFG